MCSIYMVYRLRPDLKKLLVSNSCVDGDNGTDRTIHHSLEQYTSFLLQTGTRVRQIRHKR